jgi:hypothetical protein
MTKNKLRGRPKLAAGAAKASRIILRLTEEERGRFEALAAKKGLTLSAWIRETLGSQK